MTNRTDPLTLANRRRVANAVADHLASAGLPIAPDVGNDYVLGARVTVEPGEDEAGGVYVEWRPHPRIAEKVRQAALEGRADDPVLPMVGGMTETMLNAILELLRNAGFTVSPSENDMAPNALFVTAAP